MKYNVKTSGMGCAHCTARMTKAMNNLGAEIERMELNDFDVSYDGDIESIKTAIEKLGFKLISIEAK